MSALHREQRVAVPIVEPVVERIVEIDARQEIGSGESDEAGELAELAAYNRSAFDPIRLSSRPELPLPPEPFVEAWAGYAAEAAARGPGRVFEILGEKLPQLAFPIAAGISRTGAYRAATLRGVSPKELGAAGLSLAQPHLLTLHIHPSLAGAIPILGTAHRPDFVTLVRALSLRNEPLPLPAAQHACLVKGFNNWDRIRAHRRSLDLPKTPAGEARWKVELDALIPQKHLYQDRCILLCEGPYSGVAASELGLDDAAWRALSTTLRVEHECTHYLTDRLFGSARNNLFDELLADYMGLVAALGHFRADWFLRFLGLEAHPAYRPGGRLEGYRGEPPLSDGALRRLMTLIVRAAVEVEALDRDRRALPAKERSLEVLFAMARSTLDEIAAGAIRSASSPGYGTRGHGTRSASSGGPERERHEIV